MMLLSEPLNAGFLSRMDLPPIGLNFPCATMSSIMFTSDAL